MSVHGTHRYTQTYSFLASLFASLLLPLCLRGAEGDIYEKATVGTTVTLDASAYGNPAPTFQWTKNGVAIAGATSATLILPNVTTADSGVYDAVATNSEGWALSNDLILNVEEASAPPPPIPSGDSYTPTGPTFVTGVVLGRERNDYSGWVGMQIVVGANPLSVTQLGRMMAPGNSGTHTVKLVKVSDGQDVPGGSVAIAMSGGTTGQFKYGALSAPVTLVAGTAYYLLSQEATGGDTWYDWDTVLTSTAVATDNAVAWGTGPGNWNTIAVANRAHVPLNFAYATSSTPETAVTVVATDAMAGEPGSGQGTGTFTFSRTGSLDSALTVNFTVSGTAMSGSDYSALGTTVDFAPGYSTATKLVGVFDDAQVEGNETVTVTLGSGGGYTIGNPASASVTIQDDDTSTTPDTAYVTSVVLGSLRNDYTGWVGIKIMVGTTPFSVTQLGRMVAPGNSGTHTVKLVNASDGQDVPGGAVSIATSGGTAGQFNYAALSSPVTLAPGNVYYVLSYETAGGDVWYDWDTRVTTTAVATNNAVSWGTGPGDWNSITVSNRAHAPVNFRYATSAAAQPYVTSAKLGTLRNDYSGWVGMQVIVGSNAITVSQLGRIMAPGNSGTHAVKLVRASDGGDVPGGQVSISMSGGTVGEFKYGVLNTPVTLAAWTAYYVLSQETSGGDTWYDWNTELTTTAAALDNAVVWGTGPGNWSTIGVTNRAHVPLNFTY